MSSQSFHCVGNDCPAGLVVVDSIANDETMEVLIDPADGFARADGLCGGFWLNFRITHVTRSSEKYFTLLHVLYSRYLKFIGQNAHQGN